MRIAPPIVGPFQGQLCVDLLQRDGTQREVRNREGLHDFVDLLVEGAQVEVFAARAKLNPHEVTLNRGHLGLQRWVSFQELFPHTHRQVQDEHHVDELGPRNERACLHLPILHLEVALLRELARQVLVGHLHVALLKLLLRQIEQVPSLLHALNVLTALEAQLGCLLSKFVHVDLELQAESFAVVAEDLVDCADGDQRALRKDAHAVTHKLSYLCVLR